MKKYITLLLLSLAVLTLHAQDKRISGSLIDRDTRDAVSLATVQLLRADSTMAAGTITNDSGRFVLQAPAGTYTLRVSSVGYKPLLRRVVVTEQRDVALGTLVFNADAVMLREAQVTAKALKVTVKEDTFIYNSSAYRTPEGSTIEELVKRLPGATVDENGKITINGREVKKIKVDGKEFMVGDTKTALKNIPTSIVDKVKAYDEKSDLSRVTGIDDGEDQTVLDFGTKPGMGHGLMSTVDLAAGTHSRYAGRAFGGYFNKQSRVFGMANANNVNDMGFGGRGGSWGQGRNGLNASKMVGLNFNYEVPKQLTLNGSVRWNHNNSDAYSTTSSENFVTEVGSFSNRRSQAYSRSNNWNAQLRLEWTPDTLTNIMFRPSISLGSNDGLSQSLSAVYDEDPYTSVADPLEQTALQVLAQQGNVVNLRTASGISYSSNTQLGAMLQLNRKLSSNGRNVTLRADVNYSDGDQRSLSLTDVHLYQMASHLGTDSTYQTNRYNLTPTRSWNYTVQTTYSEPLWKGAYLQLRYQFNYSYSKSDRNTYDFSHLGTSFFDAISPAYRQWDGYLSLLPQSYTQYLDEDLSRFAQYRTYTHRTEVRLRMNGQKYRFTLGMMLQPQRTHYVQQYQGVSVDTTRTVFNLSPTLDYRYNFSKVTNLRITYRGNSGAPSMSQLLNIVDDSDPLNIVTGNPGLKPSFTQSLQLYYNAYFEKTQRSFMASLSANTTSNSISNKVTYNAQTGGTLTRPENINGLWQANAALMWNTPLDSAGRWNVNTFSTLNYAHSPGYVTLGARQSSVRSTTNDMTMGERLSGSYRNDWLEVELDGSLSYRHTRNNLQATANLDTWQFAYGLNVNLTMPWGTTLSTDLHMNSRRGYTDASLNTNELVWNAQLSQSFLRSKSLTVMLQFYDLLQQQSNFSRSVSAISRSDTEYNAINSYAMLHVVYKLNLFGGKQARQDMERNRRDRDGNRGSWGRPGGWGGLGGPGGGGRPRI